MSLFGILFVVALILAIPTYGLSLIALIFAKMWINSNEAQKVAAAAINARETDGTVALPFVSHAGIRRFFKNYGSTNKKFEMPENPANTFIGYVRIGSVVEHVIMVNLSGRTTYVTSFMPPYQFGDDLLSLMAKQEFVENIIANMQKG
ncbi:hypothetical protein [Martelella sp. HB161492]|uniref:hypothetical protein n=1 Tax=Martelella sp. HB161492 TaxID=2720726 RepID=UPI001590E2FC|nr:hypothetical protein [Martelella sp. HB161492]